jgi:hypothetical protein
MKKLLILLAITVVACTKPENSDSEFSSNELTLSPAENSVNKAALGSEENPIVLPKDAFIDNVVYKLPVCGRKRLEEGTKEEDRLYVRVFEAEFEAYNSFAYDKTSKCIKEDTTTRSTQKSDFEIYNPRLYYKIFGEVVRLSVSDVFYNADSFWYKNAPGNKIQKVNFFNGGVTSIENPIPNPFKDNIDCKGLKEVDVYNDKEGKSLIKGTLIVRRGTQNVFEVSGVNVDTRFYIFRGFCGSGTFEPGVCTGIPAWVSGKNYVVGDKVVFNNFIYTRLAKGWQKGPKCN